MCSSIKLTSIENNKYWYRTCDMDEKNNVWYLGSKVVSIKENTKITLERDKEIITKYSLIGISYGKPYTRLLDGINSEGLVGGMQAFQEGTSVEEAEYNYHGIEGLDILTWFLSQCRNTEEVIELAGKTQVLNVEGKLTSKSHYTFLDNEGYSIILEATVDGKFTIFDKTIGVMTNSPGYREQIDNLENFLDYNIELNLGREDLETPKVFKMSIDGINLNHEYKGLKYSLPGDYTTKSRFIRLSVLKYLNEDGKMYGDNEMLTKAMNIIYSVNVPNNKGYYYYSEINDDKIIGGGDYYTQYIVMYDISKKELYLKHEESSSFIKYSLNNIQEELQIHTIIHNPKLGIIEEM